MTIWRESNLKLCYNKAKRRRGRLEWVSLLSFYSVWLLCWLCFSCFLHTDIGLTGLWSFVVLFSGCIWILIKWDSLLENGSHENFGISVKIFEIIKKDSIWVGVKINAVYAWWEKVRVLRYGLAKLIEPGTWNLDVVGLTKWLSWIMP